MLECNKEVGGTAELKSEIIDQTANTHKLLTREALLIWPKINTDLHKGEAEDQHTR